MGTQFEHDGKTWEITEKGFSRWGAGAASNEGDGYMRVREVKQLPTTPGSVVVSESGRYYYVLDQDCLWVGYNGAWTEKAMRLYSQTWTVVYDASKEEATK